VGFCKKNKRETWHTSDPGVSFIYQTKWVNLAVFLSAIDLECEFQDENSCKTI